MSSHKLDYRRADGIRYILMDMVACSNNTSSRAYNSMLLLFVPQSNCHNVFEPLTMPHSAAYFQTLFPARDECYLTAYIVVNVTHQH